MMRFILPVVAFLHRGGLIVANPSLVMVGLASAVVTVLTVLEVAWRYRTDFKTAPCGIFDRGRAQPCRNVSTGLLSSCGTQAQL